MSKVAFFYCNGTAGIGPFGLLDWIAGLVASINPAPRKLYTVAGMDGRTATWVDATPANDPFPNLLDPNIFDAKKIGYPAAGLAMGLSVDIGIGMVASAINGLAPGQKFMLGGYSQGACVMSSVMRMLKPGGALASKAPQFLGATMFGNPRRAVDYRGEVGGTYSGAWDTAAHPNTTGGHGAWPTTGNYSRLTPAECDPTKWIEFTEVSDVFSGVGDGVVGQRWTSLNDTFVDIARSQLVPALIAGLPLWALDTLGQVGNAAPVMQFTDGAGQQFSCGGGGHVAYPWRPPPGNPDNGLTSYQIAIKWLTAKAVASATAPIVLPSTPDSTALAGWTSALIPPAA